MSVILDALQRAQRDSIVRELEGEAISPAVPGAAMLTGPLPAHIRAKRRRRPVLWVGITVALAGSTTAAAYFVKPGFRTWVQAHLPFGTNLPTSGSAANSLGVSPSGPATSTVSPSLSSPAAAELPVVGPAMLTTPQGGPSAVLPTPAPVTSSQGGMLASGQASSLSISAPALAAAVSTPGHPALDLPPPVPLSQLRGDFGDGLPPPPNPASVPGVVTSLPPVAAGPSASAQPVASPTPKLTLGTILCEGDRCVAIINGKTVRAGQSVGEYLVLNVNGTAVTLQKHGEKPLVLSSFR